jgi:hypothetical protein
VRKLYLQYDTFLSDVGIEDSANKGSFLLWFRFNHTYMYKLYILFFGTSRYKKGPQISFQLCTYFSALKRPWITLLLRGIHAHALRLIVIATYLERWIAAGHDCQLPSPLHQYNTLPHALWSSFPIATN